MSTNFVPSVMTLEALRSVPLFASLDDAAARHLRSLLLVRNVKSNAPIFHAGDSGDSLCLIESGRVRISITDEDGKQVVLSALATDDFLRQRVSRNINEEEEAQQTFAARMADIIAEFGGSWKFIGASVSLLICWMILNTWVLREAAFDPSPYILLNLVLGIMGGLQ